MSIEILRQNADTPECRAAQQAAILLGLPIRRINLECLIDHALAISAGVAIPIGSVEFVREAMRVGEILEPPNDTYPKELRPLLRREVRKQRAGSVLGTWFVKPMSTKTFSGFVFDTMQDPGALPEYDREQYDIFVTLHPNDEVWISEPVRFLSEWRYYVLSGELVGEARYDPDGTDDAPKPDVSIVIDAISKLREARQMALTCAMDFGVIESGETALVEVNDAWALGLYGSAVPAKTYLRMLVNRWNQICQQPRDRRDTAWQSGSPQP